jgi:hypothetical protein
MSSFFLSRSAKKKIQRKKNKYQLMIYEMVRLRRDEAQRIEGEERQRNERKKQTSLSEAKKEDDLVWSAKVGEVRNRLTDKKRASKERWNRFAGTEGGGGRGL